MDAQAFAFALPAMVAAGFTAVCVALEARRRLSFWWSAPVRGAPGPRPPVLLLRPLEAGAVAQTRSSLWNPPGAGVEVVLCVPDRRTARLLREKVGDVQKVHIVVSSLAEDAAVNRKAAHLAAGLEAAVVQGLVTSDTVVVHGDSDLEIDGADLSALVDALMVGGASTGPVCGAAFAPPLALGVGFVDGAARAIVSASPQSFATLGALGQVTGSPPALSGKFVAMRAETLGAIGGYNALTPFIGDDIALVDALHHRRLSVALSPRPARAHVRDRTWRTLDAQMVRWLTVACRHRSGLAFVYPTLVAPLPLAALLAAASLLAGTWGLAVGALFALVALRLALATLLLSGPYRTPSVAWRLWRLPFEMAAGDVLLNAAVLRAAFAQNVIWASRTYAVAPGGRIVSCKNNGEALTAPVTEWR